MNYIIDDKRKLTPPPEWRNEIDFVLIREDEILTRIDEIAAQIQKEYENKELMIVALLSGTILFLADLVRRLNLPLRIDFLGISSYRTSTTSSEIKITRDLKLELSGRDVLIIDDILDTGNTMNITINKIANLKPNSIKTCVLLDKPARRKINIKADYTGFEIPDYFVVGYGLDFAERFRNLPFIGVLKKELYQQQTN
ncbi:MAG TPA: hypoxanthine phosphoribosyltransferase [Verrucomicrobiota bacterium]|nr:hypoxanthine phosphoribosyltransferase [Verrucomicrobiota bacterium]